MRASLFVLFAITYKLLISYTISDFYSNAIFYACFLLPILEELVFRFLSYKVLKRTDYVFLSSLIFSFFHLRPESFFTTQTIAIFTTVFIFSVCMSLIYLKTRKIEYCIIIHIFNNLVTYYFGSVSVVLVLLYLAMIIKIREGLLAC